MLQEIKTQRGYAKEIFIDPAKPGRIVQRVYASPKYYDNKLGLGDGVKGFRKPDTTLSWDQVRRGWTFQFHSYQPFIPEYADDILEYRDLFKEKDQIVGFKAHCAHVAGKLVPNIPGVTETNAVIYENAYGEGIDLIVAFTFRKMLRLVRIREGFRPKDARFSFEIMTAEKIQGAKAKPGSLLEPILDGKTKTERIVVGESPDFSTYINTFRVWDSGKVTGPGTGRSAEIIPITIDRTDESVIITKEIPQAFLDKAVGDVFTDDVTQYTEDKDTYYGTVFTTGGNPNGTNLAVGGWGDFYYSYLEWDLTGTPDAGFTSECTFNIKVSGVAVNNSNTTVRRVTSSWTEAGVTNAAHPTDDSTTIATMVNPVTIGAGNWDQQSILSLYQAWKDGTYSNYGIKLHSTGNSNAQHNYYSSDQGGADIPYLEVTYQLGADVTLGMQYALVGEDLFNITLRGMADAFDITFTNTETDVTKALAYTILTASEITKGLAYTVVAPAEVTKALAYTVDTQQALTLALEYAVKSAEAVTKALAYTIRTTTGITKGAEYQVRSPQAITLGAEYAVKSPAEITKALAYAVKSAQELTKALAYTVQTPGAITKGAQYTVKSPVEVTKTLAYEINLVFTHELTKSLAYAVRTANEATKALSYAVRTQNEATKGLEYEIKAPVEVTKGIKYTVQTTKELSKQLAYLVKLEKAITKSLQYEVRTEGSLTKGLAYTIRKPQAITKALAYSVASEQEITKGLEYAIISPETFTKELTYAVRTIKATTKALDYAVRKQHEITLGLEYQSGTIVDIHKTLAYAIRTESAITKALGYSVRATKGITKTLKYEVIGSAEITKALRYAVTTTPANITKGLVYALRVWPYTKKSSPYAKKTGIFTAKSRPYHKFPKA